MQTINKEKGKREVLKELVELGLPQAMLDRVGRVQGSLQDELNESGTSGNPDVVVRSKYSFSEALDYGSDLKVQEQNISVMSARKNSIQVLDYEQEESLNFEEINDSARGRNTEQKPYSVSNRNLHNLLGNGS